MNDKQQQLLGLLRGGQMKIIPARGTPQWNNLCDLIMQRSEVELKEVFAALTTRDEQQAFVWLVTVVTDFDTAKHIIWKTLATALVHRELLAQEDAIQTMWKDVDKAYWRNQVFAKRRKLILRQCAKLRRTGKSWRERSVAQSETITVMRENVQTLLARLDAQQARIAELETTIRVVSGLGVSP